MLDYDMLFPHYLLITDGKKWDNTAAKQIPIAKGMAVAYLYYCDFDLIEIVNEDRPSLSSVSTTESYKKSMSRNFGAKIWIYTYVRKDKTFTSQDEGNLLYYHNTVLYSALRYNR